MGQMSREDIATAFAQAGFRVSCVEPEGRSAEDQEALRRRRGKAERKRAERREAIAAEEHAKKVSAFIHDWELKNGDRPTEERRTHGVFRTMEVIDATAEVDMAATMLDRLHEREIITYEQCQAGHSYAMLMRRMQMVPEGRSCLDTTPVGYIDDSEPTHAELRDKQDRDELYLACGVFTWRELRRVCVEMEAPRSVDRLRTGLDICVKFWC